MQMLESVQGSPGFATGLRFSPGELGAIKGAIKEHLAATLGEVSPKEVALVMDTPLERYHEISAHIPHQTLVTRTARILPESAVQLIRSTSLAKQLEDAFGPFLISDEEKVGRESISMRLVRPGMESDVGSLHCDDWFWDIYKFEKPTTHQRVKVWTAISCEPGKGGLLVSGDSHKRPWKYNLTERAGMQKPLLDPAEKPATELFQSQPGDGIVFNYHLLHGGAVTSVGSVTRVSVEFTILVPNEAFTHATQ